MNSAGQGAANVLGKVLHVGLYVPSIHFIPILRKGFLAEGVPVMVKGLNGPGAPHLLQLDRRCNIGFQVAIIHVI